MSNNAGKMDGENWKQITLINRMYILKIQI